MVQTATFISKRGTGLAHTEAELLDNPVAGRPTLILRSPDFHAITEAVAEPIERRTPIGWWLFFLPSLALLSLLGVAVSWLFWEGIGVWGLNVPVGWAWDITNFVFWVGIGHAGTLISAILFLFRQKWRTSINRAAEAMTIFAVMCALTFPGIHVGRVWLAYWMFPIPNQMGMWPNFRSPLLWDVFAVSIYGTVSVLFWYVGLIPDLATMRDRATTPIRRFAYGVFALGWRGSVRQWHHYETAYLVLAGLATPLVLSVHSIVSMDFAVSVLPGWHTTIFPPYFVAGAIFSGFAMVLTLMVICRKVFHLEHIVTLRHFDFMAKIMLVTGTMVGYAYATEFFTSWYSGNPYELFTFMNRALGPYAWAYWIMITCNVISPQIFWSKKARTSIPILFVVSIVINIGMWFERFVIIVTSLHRDFLPSAWGYFTPTMWDVACLLGSFGLFFTMFCLFVRFLPMVATAEVKTVLPQADPHWQSGPEHGIRTTGSSRPHVAGTSVFLPSGDVVSGAGAGARSRWNFQMPLLPRLPKGPYYGTLAEFATPADLYHACEGVRDAGFTRWDAHSPFPVHGLDKAMGLRRSQLPWIVLVMTLAGAALGFGLQWWVHAIAQPLVISGKPFFTWPAFIPITFELGVLFGALGAVFGMLGLNRLPMHHHPLFRSKVFERASDDTFFISIESWDPRFDPSATGKLLESLGARSVELLES
jgi:molybdopterin-containing oxidoreductase family membrane subunit